MLNLGMIQPATAMSVLKGAVCLSEPMAKQEVDRYTFSAPGQATRVGSRRLRRQMASHTCNRLRPLRRRRPGIAGGSDVVFRARIIDP